MSKNLAAYVAAELRAEMARRQTSAAEMARSLDVHEVWVGRRLRGQTPITLDDLERLAKVLEIPVSRLLPAAERVA